MTSLCLDRKEVRHLASAQSKDRLAGGDTGRLFLTFGGPVSPTGVSNCPLDRVLTYKNLIKRPARDACLCMGELQAPPAPPAPAAPPAPPAPPAPHFVFLITL